MVLEVSISRDEAECVEFVELDFGMSLQTKNYLFMRSAACVFVKEANGHMNLNWKSLNTSGGIHIDMH